MADNTIKIFTIKVDTTEGKIAIDGLTKGFVKSDTAFKKLGNTIRDTTKKGVSPLADATGLAGAAVNELGRTVSDAGYGIQGMANNISQLGSLFAILIARTGGFTNALKVMGKQFVGPLGVLFVFQAAVAALEYFSRETKKADDNVKNLDNTFSKQSSSLQAYVKILDDSNISLNEKRELVEEINEEHKDLNIQIDEEGRLTEDSKNKTLLYIEAIKQKAKAQALIVSIQNNYQEQLKIENQELDEQIGTFDVIISAIKNYGRIGSTSVGIVTKGIENQGKALDDIDKQNDEYIKKLEQIGVIPEINEEKEKKIRKAKKDFVAKELSFADDILKSQDKVNKKITKSQFVRLEQEEELQKKLAQIKFDEYKERELARANAIKDPEDRRKAIEKANEAIGRSLASLSQYEIQLTKETQDKKTQIIADAIVKQFDLATQLNAKEREAILGFEASMATNELDKIDVERKLEDEKLNNKLNALDIEKQKRIENGEFYGDILIKEEQAENASERQKTKFKEKEEKARLGIANQVGQAIMSIAGEGSAVGKAVAVAMAIMNTKEAITAALGAKPYGPWNIAQAVATGVFGMQQVREIMSTKLPEAAGGSGGGAGASMSVSAPDFNVVGQGAGSQVAQAVTSAQDRPFRAYVVSGDVTSAQELDRKTLTESAIG